MNDSQMCIEGETALEKVVDRPAHDRGYPTAVLMNHAAACGRCRTALTAAFASHAATPEGDQ